MPYNEAYDRIIKPIIEKGVYGVEITKNNETNKVYFYSDGSIKILTAKG